MSTNFTGNFLRFARLVFPLPGNLYQFRRHSFKKARPPSPRPTAGFHSAGALCQEAAFLFFTSRLLPAPFLCYNRRTATKTAETRRHGPRPVRRRIYGREHKGSSDHRGAPGSLSGASLRPGISKGLRADGGGAPVGAMHRRAGQRGDSRAVRRLSHPGGSGQRRHRPRRGAGALPAAFTKTRPGRSSWPAGCS